jgi:hypothetical protein
MIWILKILIPLLIGIGKIFINIMSKEVNKSNNSELIDIYSIMFNPIKARLILHGAIYENKFVSLDVQQDIEVNNLSYKKILINGKHTLHIYVPQQNQEHVSDNISPNINTIATIIDFMENIAKIYFKKHDINYGVNIVAVYSNQKKLINENTNTMCCDNINSGCTYFGNSTSQQYPDTIHGIKIICWRCEEFYKVLIHELFHYYGFDFFSNDAYYKELELLLNKGINDRSIPTTIGPDMINECYTEASTILISCIFKTVTDSHSFIGNDNNTLNKIMESISNELMENVKRHLTIEICFLTFQVAKILHLFGAKSFTDYVINKVKIIQTTSCRSYFILKLLLLVNIDKMIEMMDGGLIIQGKKLLELGNLINNSLNYILSHNVILGMIDKYINMFYDKNIIKSNKWIYVTCRMSAIDL